MENKPVSVWKGTINPALMLGFVLVIYTLIFYFIGRMYETYVGLISMAISIVGLVLCIRAFRNDSRNGILSYGGAVGAGTVTSLYAGIILAIFTLLLYKVIDPDQIEKYYTFLEEQMIAQGRATETQMEFAMDFNRKLLTPFTLPILGILGNVFSGVIISLIAAIFLKKEGDGFQKAMADVEDQPAE